MDRCYSWKIIFTTIFLLLLFFIRPSSQGKTLGDDLELTPLQLCNGVFLEYKINDREKIHPFFPKHPKKQPVAFDATVIVHNGDSIPLIDWALFIEFPNGTVIVKIKEAILQDDLILPYIVGQNGTIGVTLTGGDKPDLKTAIETAGELNLIQAEIGLVGTQFGLSPPVRKLPSKLKLATPGYICPEPELDKAKTTIVSEGMHTCCLLDPKFRPNSTTITEKVHKRSTVGDMKIAFDVTQSNTGKYIALVKMQLSKDNVTFGRLDNWRLKWTWPNDEFILNTKGAYTTIVNPSKCLFGPQGKEFPGMDFNGFQNCDLTPTFLDLPVQMSDDEQFGRIPFCCRNGTMLPYAMDPNRSASAFQIQVYKMPPQLNRTTLVPPRNWKISGSNGAINPNFECGPPVRVSPTIYPNDRDLRPTLFVAIASWEIVCNITKPEHRQPSCCVTFSSYYNKSIIPCPTCSCGCPKKVAKTCSTESPALFLPTDALLVPFDNRTAKIKEWARLKHFTVPEPLPCGDHCGITINWHVSTDHIDGWSARMTLFNWGDFDVAKWFAMVDMGNAYKGFEAMYSFNGSDVGNNTLFMQGLEGLDYLVKIDKEEDPMVPGKLQSVISFKKKYTPGIDIVAGDGFPKKVFFNGEECVIPTIFPTSIAVRSSIAALKTYFFSVLLLVILSTF